MVASRLVSLIEQHAEKLTHAVVHELRTDRRTPSYRKLAANEHYARVFAVVHNLGMWLDHKSDATTEDAYRSLGQKRFSEDVPLSEVVCALMLTERTIRRFIQTEVWLDSALDLRQQVELYTLINRFFERAVYFTVLSYEAVACSSGKWTATHEAPKGRISAGWTLRKGASAV